MNNYATATKYATDAANSNGTAMKKMDIYEQSVEGRTKALTSAFQSLSQAFIGSDLVKDVTNIGTSAINVLTQIISKLGAIPALISTISAAMSVMGKNGGILTPIQASLNGNGGLDWSSIFKSTSFEDFQKQIDNDVTALNSFKVAVKNGQEPTSALAETMAKASQTAKDYASNVIDDDNAIKKYATSQAAASKAITETGNASKLAAVGVRALNFVLNTAIIALVSWGIEKAIEGISNWINRVEIQKQKVEELSTAYDTSKQKVTDINTQLSETQKQVDALNAKPKLTFVEQKQLETLKETTKELQLQADVAQKKADQAARELGENALKSYNNQFGGQSFEQSDIEEYLNNANSTGNNAILMSNTSDVEQMIAAYKQLDSLKEQAINSQDNEEIERYNSLITDTKDDLNNDVSALQAVQTALEKVPIADRTEEETNALDNINKAIDLIYQNIDPDKLNEVNSSLSTTDESVSSIADSITTNIDGISTEIKTLGDSFKDLDNVIASVTEGQSLSGEEVLTLLQTYPELTDAIQGTSGGYTFELSVLTELRKEKIQAQVDSIQAEINTAQQTLASTQQRLNAYSTEIQGINSLAEAKERLSEIESSGDNTDSDEKKALKTYIDYQGALKTVTDDQQKLKVLQTELTLVSQPNYTKAINKTTEATKQAKSAAEEYKDALNKQKDALDQEKKSLQDAYDQMQTDQENIKSLLSLVEEMLKKQYDEQKDAYQKRVDQISDEADKEKTALEDQLKVIKDKIDLQKKALDQQKDERQHQEDLASKEKELADLRTKLTVQQLDNSEESKKRQLDLENQITDKTKSLDDFKYDYATTTQENELDSLQDKYDKEYKAKEDELDKETTAQKNYYQGLITKIETYTSKEVNIRTEAMSLINSRSQGLLNRLLEYNRVYGDGVESTVRKTFSDGYNSLMHFNNGQINILNTLNQLIDRMGSYKTQIRGVDNQISSLESKIQEAEQSLNDVRNSANGAAGSIQSVVSDSKYAYKQELQNEIDYREAELKSHYEETGELNTKDENIIYDLRKKLNSLSGYANGTENASGGLSRIDEHGLENIFQPDGKGNYVMLNRGAEVMTAENTQNLTQWGKFNPATFALQFQRQLQSIASNAVTNNNTPHIENNFIVQGTVDESVYDKLYRLQDHIITQASKQTLDNIKAYRQSGGIKKTIYNY